MQTCLQPKNKISHQSPTFNFGDEWGECPQHGRWLRSFGRSGKRYAVPLCPECKKEFEYREVLGRASIPPRYAGKTFDQFKIISKRQRVVFESIKRYSEGFREYRQGGVCQIWHGLHGTGKNHMAVATCIEVARQGFTAMILTAAELLQTLRDTYSSKDKTIKDVLPRLVEVDLLFIDEVGRTKATEDANNLFFQAINGRYLNMKPTIIITNLDPDQLEEHLGPAIYDRLKEGGGSSLFFGWDSFRRTKFEDKEFHECFK